MKPDPYKAKASHAWKRKHNKNNKAEIVQVCAPQNSIQDDASVDPEESDLSKDTNTLVDLKNKLIINDQKRDYDFLDLQLKFTLQLATKDRAPGKSFKGFHDPIFSRKSSPQNIPKETRTGEEKKESLEEWLDDILG